MIANLSNVLTFENILIPLITLFLSVGGVYLAARKLDIFFKESRFQAQLEAKDDVIHTNEQTIAANKGRIEGLEEELQNLAKEIAELKAAFTESKIRYEELQKYAAPQAVEDLKNAYKEQTDLLKQIIDKLT